MGAMLSEASERLTRLRAARVQSLYDLWMSPSFAADALVWAAMRAGIDAAGLPVSMEPVQAEGGQS